MAEEADFSMTSMAMGNGVGDETLAVRFYETAVQNKAKSLEAGRPIFEDRVFIDIRQPGNTNVSVNRPIRDGDKKRFPRHWAAFQNNKEQTASVVGTPLSEWPGLTQSQRQELIHQNIHTVEQLANMADGSGVKMLGIQTIKQQAQAWLEASDKQAAINKLAEQQELNARLMARIEALEAGSEKLQPVTDEISEADILADEISEAYIHEAKPKRKRRTKAEMEAAREA